VLSLTSDPSGTLFASTEGYGRVFRSSSDGDLWTTTNNGLDSVIIRAVIADPAGRIFAATGAGIYRSTNQGGNWFPANTGLTHNDVRCVTLGPGGSVFAGTSAGNDGIGVFQSTDGGAHWAGLNTGFAGEVVLALASDSNGNILAGLSPAGVYRSTDNGQTWGSWGTGLPYADVVDLAVDSMGALYAATGIFGVLRKVSDSDQNWVYTKNISYAVSLAVAPGARVYAGGTGVSLLGADNLTWSPLNTGMGSLQIRGFRSTPGGHIFAATYGDGVWRRSLSETIVPLAAPVQISPPDGSLNQRTPLTLHWRPVTGATMYHAQAGVDSTFSTGLTINDSTLTDTSLSISALSAGARYFWHVRAKNPATGGAFAQAWKFTLSLTGIAGGNGTPYKFDLEQNYPNPFNPSTVVIYQLPAATDVKLAVYDLLGREVAVLVNEKKDAGRYEVRFTAGGLASGVYFYRLSAGQFVKTNKFVLLK
jgi:hypothetical protein